MKYWVIILLLILSFTIKDDVFASEKALEYNLLPNYITKGDEVDLEIFYGIDGTLLPEKIKDLKVESLDRLILDVVSIESDSGSKTTVKLIANDSGDTTLYIFSEGVKSLEIPITVYADNGSPKSISLDIFPSTIDLKQNNGGILSITLVDDTGIPTVADKDYFVKLSASKSNFISFEEPNLIISKGESNLKTYIKGITVGDVTINAVSDDMKSSSKLAIVDDVEQEIKISIIPELINSYNTSYGNIIAQLYSNGKLAKATEDIAINFKIKSDSSTITSNKSSEVNNLSPIGYFQIKKGQSWGHSTFSIQKGISESYTMTLTSQKPLQIIDKSFDTLDVELFDDKEIKFVPLSVLADGSRQLIGVIYLEDNNGHPVIANRDIVVPFMSSSDLVTVEPPLLKNGDSTALVFGKLDQYVTSASVAPKSDNSELIELDIYGHEKESTELKINIPHDSIPVGTETWVTLYLESSETHIPFRYDDLVISDSDIMDIDKSRIEQFGNDILLPVKFKEIGDDTVSIGIGEFQALLTMTGVTNKPSAFELDHSKDLFAGIGEMFTIQLLNSQSHPAKANEDTTIKIFSSDPGVIEFPKSMTIKKNSDYVKFQVFPKNPGKSEVSFVAEGFSVLTKDIEVKELSPSISISSNDVVNQEDTFTVSVSAKQSGAPLSNANVLWDIEGGFSTVAEEKTGPTGEALASITAISNDKVSVTVTVTNAFSQSASISKEIRVNATSVQDLDSESKKESFSKPSLLGFDPVLIIVPGVIGGVVFLMRKKSKKHT